jgi:hypothetical protein
MVLAEKAECPVECQALDLEDSQELAELRTMTMQTARVWYEIPEKVYRF